MLEEVFFAMNRQILQIQRSLALVGLAVALLVGGGLGWTLTSSAKPVLGAARAVTLSLASPAPQTSGGGSLAQGFADTIQPILPSVVNIQVASTVQNTRQQQRVVPSFP